MTALEHVQVVGPHQATTAEELLELIDTHQIDTLVTVPVILRRLVELPRHIRRRYDLTSLRCVAVSGSALPGELATEFMDAFGDILYNLYGSTEAAFATCAAPDDLRADPGTAGKPLAGVHIEVLDLRGRRGRIGSAPRSAPTTPWRSPPRWQSLIRR